MQRLLKGQKSSNTYQSCSEITVAILKRCIVDNDYSGLDKTGKATQKEKDDAFLTIYSEYCELKGDVDIRSMINRARTIRSLAAKIDRLVVLYNTATMVASPDICASLKADGLKLDPEVDDEVYFAQLRVISSKIKNHKMHLDELLREAPQADGKKQTDEDFDIALINISKFMGYEVNDNITVRKFCLYLRQLQAHIQLLIKQQQKGHGRRKAQ